jgi:hypothetical protein
MNNLNKSSYSVISLVSSMSRPSVIQSKILLEMFKMGSGSSLGLPAHVGVAQIGELQRSGLISVDTKNNIYPTKVGMKLLESLILGEDDCTYPLKEANAAEKFKKGIPLHLLAKSSSISRM